MHLRLKAIFTITGTLYKLCAISLGLFSLNWLTVPSASAKKPMPDFQILISIHWEGLSIEKRSLEAINSLRTNFPEARIVHLLNSAYLARIQNEAEKEKTIALMRNAIGSKDYIGLHFNPFRTLANQANIPFRRTPTFWGNSISQLECRIDCGHEVPTSAYSAGEFQEMLNNAKQTIADAFDAEPVFFHAGGWALSSDQLKIVEQSGFLIDLSSVAADALKSTMSTYPLMEILKAKSLPSPENQSIILSPKFKKLIQLKNHLGYVSYHSRNQLKARFIKFMSNNTDLVPVWTLSISQETAAIDVQVLSQTIWDINKIAREKSLTYANFDMQEMKRYLEMKSGKMSSPIHLVSSLFNPAEQPEFSESTDKRQNNKQAEKENKPTSEKLRRLAVDFYSKMLEYSR